MAFVVPNPKEIKLIFIVLRIKTAQFGDFDFLKLFNKTTKFNANFYYFLQNYTNSKIKKS